MEEFFYNKSPDPILWFEPEPELEPEHNSPIFRSAFENYSSKKVDFQNESCSSNNINKRIIGFLKRSWDEGVENKEIEKERCYKHMMSERMRREKQKNGFMSLLTLLPTGTKNDKKTIVQVAIDELKQLQNQKEELERKEIEFQAILAARETMKPEPESSMIKLRVPNPDSILEVLKCVKNMGCETRAIHWNLSEQELSAIFEI